MSKFINVGLFNQVSSSWAPNLLTSEHLSVHLPMHMWRHLLWCTLSLHWDHMEREELSLVSSWEIGTIKSSSGNSYVQASLDHHPKASLLQVWSWDLAASTSSGTCFEMQNLRCHSRPAFSSDPQMTHLQAWGSAGLKRGPRCRIVEV